MASTSTTGWRSGSRSVSLAGVDVPAIPPEDLIVIKAIVHDEESPRHWHDALGVLAGTSLDWDYLLERAKLGPNRLLSLAALRALGGRTRADGGRAAAARDGRGHLELTHERPLT